MFVEIHFGGPHFDPQARKLKLGQKIQNQHQKCFPTIYNMTMFEEIHFGRPPGDPLPGAQKSNLGQTKKS